MIVGARTVGWGIAGAVLLAAGACASGSEVVVESAPEESTTTGVTTTTEATNRVPDDGLLAVWAISGGECGDPCAFTGTFLADGTLLWSSGRGGAVVEFDPEEAIATNGSLTADALVAGADDCMPEVDGNAPSLFVRDVAGDPLEIDTCYARLADDHPFAALTRDPVDRARAAVSPLVVRVALPDAACDANGNEECPTTMHDVFADGLVIVSHPSSIADARPVPTEARHVDVGLVEQLRAVAVAGLDRDDLCAAEAGAAVETSYAFSVDDEIEADLVRTSGCVVEAEHPAIVLADRLVGG